MRERAPGVEVTKVLAGSPKHLVLDEAESFGADLLVIGSQGHGRGRGHRFHLGSVSHAAALSRALLGRDRPAEDGKAGRGFGDLSRRRRRALCRRLTNPESGFVSQRLFRFGIVGSCDRIGGGSDRKDFDHGGFTRLRGAPVLRGLSGFGAKSRLHTARSTRPAIKQHPHDLQSMVSRPGRPEPAQLAALGRETRASGLVV
ncbi:MAG TPA: universal stress protein [Thermoanaerobaculia bacterium]|nr:universal stress protein [Thermoanaerobaculia bacterium]